MKKVPVPTGTTPGVWPQPVASVALQVAASMTATLFARPPNGTYRVFVVLLNAGGPGNLPTVIVGGLAEQPAVCVALQVAMLITDARLENGSVAYSLRVTGAMDCGG